MIDKRINYRFGGGYQGSSAGPVDRGGGRQESGGGGGRQEYSAQQYTAPKPTPEPTPRGEDLHQGPTVKEVLNKVAEDKKEQAAITSLEKAIKETSRGVDLHQGPMVKEVLTDLRQKQQDPNYGQFFRPQPVVEKPKFFDTGLGNVVKNIGLGVVAPQLLAGTAFAKPYNLYRQYQTAKRFIPKDTRQTLINNLTTPKRTKTINTTSKDDRDDRREEGIMQAQTPQNIIEENIQKFSPEQLNLLRKRYAELQQVIESGEYNGQKLNNNQLATLTQTSKQMNDFLVSEVGGMRLT
jgi:hypothetical protein